MQKGRRRYQVSIFLYVLAAAGLLIWSGPLAAQGDKAQEGGSPLAAQNPGVQPSYQDYVNLLAGNHMEAAALAAYVNPAGWHEYAQEMQRLWQRFDHKRLKPMRDWANQELVKSAEVTGTVFYPFSGPDVANLLAFFPRAKTYLLIALEPVGSLPVFQPGKNEPFYCALEQALSELLKFNFFFTKRMECNLVTRQLDGVLPVLLYFLGREQVRVQEVSFWLLQPDGKILEQPVQAGEKLTGAGIPGVKIVFRQREGAPEQTLYYFRFNLQDGSWRSNPQFIKFLKSLAPFETFVKAASYLMFKPHFSEVRRFILDQSRLVLQTDEGIPVRYFDPEKWDHRFYGKYSCPIQLFANCYQPDLARMYRSGQEVKPLPFAIGYHHRPHSSNLMLISRKAVLAEGGAK